MNIEKEKKKIKKNYFLIISSCVFVCKENKICITSFSLSLIFLFFFFGKNLVVERFLTMR